MTETVVPAPGPEPQAPAPRPPARKWPRRLRRGAIALAVLILVVRVAAVALAPSILDHVLRGVGLTCSVGRLEVSVLSGELEVAHVIVAPRGGGEPIADLGYLRADVSPLALLAGRVVVRRLELDGLDVLVDREADGRFALERLAAAQVGSGAPAAAKKPEEPAKKASDRAPPPVLIEALHASHVHVHVRDASVKPALDARLELNLGVVDLAFLSSSTRPARIALDVTCPPILDGLRVEGTTTTDGTGALTVALDRLHLAPLAPYLEPLRVRPQARDISFGLELTGRVHGTAAVVTLERVALTADGREALALDALLVDVRKLASDRVEVARVLLRGIRADVTGLPDGSLRVAGVDLLPPKPLPEGAPEPAEEPATSSPTAAPQVALDELALEDARATFVDENPPAELSLHLESLRVTGVDPARPEAPARIDVALAAPGVVESIAVSATAFPFAAAPTFHASVSGDKLTLRALAPYLRRSGVEPLLADGRFSLEVSGHALQGRPMEGDLSIEKVALSEGDRELAGIDGVRLSGARLDIEESSLSIASIEVARPRLAPVARDRSGSLLACGLRIAPSSLAAREAPEPRRPRHERSGVQGKPPHVRLGKLLVEKARARFDDDFVSPPAALVLADARLSVGAIDLDLAPGARDPAPTSLEATLAAPGNVESIEVLGSLVASARAPSLALTVEAKGVTARAAAAYLEKAGIEPELKDGHLEVSLGANATIDPAGKVQASLGLERLRWRDGDRELLALTGLRAKDVKLDPAKLERVDVGLLELERLSTAVATEPHGVLALLGFTLTPPSSAAEDAGLPPPTRTAEKAAPVVRVGKVRFGELAVDLHEASEEPAFDLPLRAQAGLGPLVFDASGRAPLEDAPFGVQLSAKGAFELFVVDGKLAASPRAARVEGRLGASGITARALRDRLAKKGFEPLLKNGTFSLDFEARADVDRGQATAELHLHDFLYGDGFLLAGLDAVDVTGVRAAEGTLDVASILVDGPRARVAKDEHGALEVGGFRIVPRPPAPASAENTAPVSNAGPPLRVSLGAFALRHASVAWTDSSVQPGVSLAVTAAAHVEKLVLGSEDARPARVELRVAAPSVLELGLLDGELSVKPSEIATHLQLVLDGVRAGPLAPYLGAGARSELERGSLHADVAARLVPHEAGPAAELAVTRIDWRDVNRPLLHVDELSVRASELSPARVAIEKLALEGVEAHVEKTPAGETRLLGLVLAARPAPVATATATAAKTEPAAQRPRRARRDRPPLVGVDALRVSVRELSFLDRSKAGSEPVVVSKLVLENTKPVRVLGTDPASQPPIELRLSTELAPIASSIVVTTRLAPFALEPDFAVSLAIDGLRGAGLTRVAPDLAAKLDGTGLVDGHATASATLALRTGRRDPLDFSALSNAFGLDLTVGKVDVHDGPKGPVLAGLDELHADVARIDSLSNVHVRALEVARPAGLVRKEAGGLRVLDILLKDQPESTGDPSPAPAAPATGPKREIKVDRFSVTDVAFTFEDLSNEVPMIVPLTGLDLNVTSFTTKAFEERRSFAFDAVLKAGKVRLPKRVPKDAIPGASSVANLLSGVKDAVTGEKTKKAVELEERPLFDEIAVKGELALAPGPFGRIEASVTGLELQDLKGPAAASGITLDDGLLDADATVGFGAPGDVAARATITLTDLDLDENENGPIRRFFSEHDAPLPAPTRVVIFVLRDEEGAIEIPIEVKIPPLTGDMTPSEKMRVLVPRIVGAALQAFARIAARAVLHSPFRVLTTGTDVVKGSLELIPGGQLASWLEKPKVVEEPVVLHFAAGDGSLPDAELAKLAPVAKKLGDDEELVVTLRHAVGGGDLGRERIAANPSPRDRRDIVARLSARRADLQRERAAALAEERAALRDALPDAESARARAVRLEEELASTERGLDSVLELERDGAERQADRRTRAACLELARSRLEAVRAFLAAAPGAADDRIRVSRPRVEEAPGDDGGTVTVTISQRKKR